MAYAFPSAYIPQDTDTGNASILAGQEYTIMRVPSASYTNGVYTEAPPATFTITANIQPATLRDVSFYEQSLEAGQRTGELIRIYTGATLLVPVENEEASVASDKITWEGNVYRVVRRAKWHSNILSHNKYLAVLEAT